MPGFIPNNGLNVSAHLLAIAAAVRPAKNPLKTSAKVDKAVAKAITKLLKFEQRVDGGKKASTVVAGVAYTFLPALEMKPPGFDAFFTFANGQRLQLLSGQGSKADATYARLVLNAINASNGVPQDGGGSPQEGGDGGGSGGGTGGGAGGDGSPQEGGGNTGVPGGGAGGGSNPPPTPQPNIVSGSGALPGTPGADSINGGSGNDTLTGNGGNDTFTGGAGNDTFIVNNNGNATITDLTTGDILIIGQGSQATASPVSNFVASSASRNDGSATFNAADGGALIDLSQMQGSGSNTINGGAGDDTLTGNSGNDQINGGAGNDTLAGGAGNDTLDGGAGDDSLQGGAGNDSLRGGAGNDTLTGGAGDDTLEGGAGRDVYNLAGGGIDTVREAGSAVTVTLNGGGLLAGLPLPVQAVVTGFDVVNTFTAGTSVLEFLGQNRVVVGGVYTAEAAGVAESFTVATGLLGTATMVFSDANGNGQIDSGEVALVLVGVPFAAAQPDLNGGAAGLG